MRGFRRKVAIYIAVASSVISAATAAWAGSHELDCSLPIPPLQLCRGSNQTCQPQAVPPFNDNNDTLKFVNAPPGTTATIVTTYSAANGDNGRVDFEDALNASLSPGPGIYDYTPGQTRTFTATNTSATQNKFNISINITNFGTEPQFLTVNITCAVPPPAPGTIVIAKIANNGNGTFTFNGDLGSFSIATVGSPGTGSQTFSNLAPGTYNVSEVVPAGWTLNGVSCGTGGTGSGVTATIVLPPGGTVQCSFTNTKNPTTGSITIVKQSNGGNSTFTFNASGSIGPTFSITTTGASGGTPGSGSSLFSNLAPGTYTVSEVVPAGWNFDSVSCVGDLGGAPTTTAGSTATIGLDAGENITCTFINSLNPGPATGSITIVKETNGGDATFSFSGTLGNFSIATHTGAGSTLFDNLAPGTYTVSEIVPAQWQFVSLTCTGDTGGTATTTAGMTATIGLDAGEKIVCTFVNKSTIATGSITIVKQSNGGNSTFTFNASGSIGPTFSITTTGGSGATPGSGSSLFSNLTPGTYTVSEVVPPGWNFDSVSCVGDLGGTPTTTGGTTATIGLDAGENITCTFINSMNPGPATGSITIVKETNGADFTFNFVGTLGNFAVTTHSGAGSAFFDNLAPGAYTVSEIVPAQWQFVSLTCTGDTGGTPTTTAGTTATIGLDAGEKIVCTYVNKSTFVPPVPGTAAITIVKQTNGRDNTFSFTSTISSHQNFTLTTVDGSASVTFDQIAIGTYTIAEGSLPTGWSLSSLSCMGVTTSTTNVGSRSTTITVVSGAAATCTFTNTFDEGFIRQRTTEAIRNFMNRRADILTSEEPDRNRYIRRLSGSLWGDPGSSAPFSFTGSSDAGFGQMSFGTSLSQIANSMVTKEKGGKTTMAWNQDIDVWFEGHYNYYQDHTIDGSSGHFGLLYFGADYLVTPRILVGALVQYDLMAESSGSTGIRTSGTGWMAGPYFSTRLSSNVYLDGRLAWGKSNNTISPFGTFSDPFETTRALARLNITGNWVTGPIRITPSVGVTYFTERQDSYTDSLGVYIPSQSITLGRMTFGPEFAYRYPLDNGWVVEPTLATTGIWDFQKDGTMTVQGITVGTNSVRAKVTAGAIVTSPQAFNARLVVSYDGIGDQHLSVYGAQLWLNSHFPAAGTPVKQPHEPPFSWTGFYIGGHAGFGVSEHRQDFSFGGQDAPGAVGAFDQQTSMLISGVQFGYNYQWGRTVVGVEVDAKWPSLNPAFRTVFVDPTDDDDQFRARSRLELGGSLRGRIGYTWRHALFYGTAGLAVGRIKTEVMPDGGSDTDLPATIYSNVATRIGWTAGIGLEYAITNNVLGRVEYRYTDYGQSSFAITDPLLLPSYGPNQATQSLALSEWLFGLNYKF